MRLNPDCVRDILLFLEENLTLNSEESNFEGITLFQLTESMMKLYPDKYTQDDIWYTIYNLKQVQFIEGMFQDAGRQRMYICNILNISWSGHQFLATIRPKTIWDATKNKAKEMGGMSLSGLSMISSSIIQGLASNTDFIQSIVNTIK